MTTTSKVSRMKDIIADRMDREAERARREAERGGKPYVSPGPRKPIRPTFYLGRPSDGKPANA